jgi:hypothetical protein
VPSWHLHTTRVVPVSALRMAIHFKSHLLMRLPSPNKALDSTGFCACVLPFGFSMLTVSPPVSHLTLAIRR